MVAGVMGSTCGFATFPVASRRGGAFLCALLSVAMFHPAAPRAQDDPAPGGPAAAGTSVKSPSEPFEMTTYQFAILKNGPNTGKLTPEVSGPMLAIQLERFETLLKMGKLIVTGPVEGGGDVRGIAVFNMPDAGAVREMMKDDPFVKAGTMTIEIHPWFTAKGVFGRPPVFLDLEPCILGILSRPAGAPQFAEEKLQQLQEGHMGNIRAMHEAGELVTAGPFADDGTMRGVFLFRSSSEERVKELVSKDPSIQAHRLEMTLYHWRVSKGILPAADAP